MQEELVLRCALGREFLYRPKVATVLLERFSSIRDLAREVKECNGISADVMEALQRSFSPQALEWAEEEVEWCAQKGIKLLFPDAPGYPQLLLEIPDNPFMLYYKGTANLNNPHSISMVGTRMASAYGKQACGMVVEHLLEYSPLVVSGLAYGIDIASHRAALENGVPTVAVLPNGLDMIYPSRHRGEAVQMVRNGGGLLTEFPRGYSPQKMNFIKRNRIIAAMSQALVVVESRVKGGSMITAEYASNYNRDIFAIPGRLSDSNSFGCNYLIAKNVAAIYNSAAAIPHALGWSTDVPLDPSLQPQLFSFDIENKEKILLTLKFDKPVGIEEICRQTGLAWAVASALLLELEVEGRVVAVDNADYCLKR